MTFRNTSNTDTAQKKFHVCNIPDLLKFKNVWNPKAGGKKVGVAQAGGQERNLQVFIFISHPALLDPLSAWASSPPTPVGQEGETCLPRHPVIKQHLLN